jgi:hypothetical protein
MLRLRQDRATVFIESDDLTCQNEGVERLRVFCEVVPSSLEKQTFFSAEAHAHRRY